MNYKSALLIFLSSFLLISIGFSQFSFEEMTQSFEWRNIGPANQGGRISDIEADRNDFRKVFIAVASGGVWKSENAGTTWMPIFDDYETASIGDIAIGPNDNNTIWVGTGEANNRNSSSWGNGVYKSTDGGESFEHMGLESTHQIPRLLIHPEQPDNVCVCAVGHLWGYSGDRGLFQTTDGGKNWNKLGGGLPDDGKTGCTDIVRDPNNPDILYTAFYHRLRKPWHFYSGGDQGGIFKSVDGGKNWKKLSKGLPEGPTGRIGLAIYEKDSNILMAIVEAEKTDTLSVPGTGIYRSEDAGESWTYMNTYNNRPFYYSQIRINPNDDQRVYVLTTRFMVSNDGGKTFENGSPDAEVHGDFHALWLDPKDEDRYYLGADKGFSLTHDHGKHFQLFDNLPIAQFYRINFDMQDPYYVYGGLQDNGSYATASFTRDARGILNDSNWKMHWGDGQDAAANPNDWTDMYTSMEKGSFFKYNPQTRELNRISPSSFNTSNFDDYFDEEDEDFINARRFNWSAPMVMSTHNPHHLYVGGNYLYKTTNQGKEWKIISPDLSTNHPEKRIYGNTGGITPDAYGSENHCSIVTIAPSEIDEQLIWVGTDDGNVQVTKNGGKKWKNMRDKIPEVPEGIWANRVEASKFEKGRAYVCFDGHRSDHFGTWVFVTDNYGKSWKKITNGITEGEVVRVIREDVKNPNLLFAGTETGVWVSVNRGSDWKRLKLNMPTVSIYDMKIHPRENDLIVGTHGRSLWVLDDISPLQNLENLDDEKAFQLFDQDLATLWVNKSRGGQRGHFWFAGDNPKTIKNTSSVPRALFDNLVAINYTVNTNSQDSLTLEISSKDGKLKKELKVPGTKGIHKYYWNREFDTEAFTKEDLEELEMVLRKVRFEINNSRVKSIYSKFKLLEDSDQSRRLIKPLTGGYLSVTFDEKFLIPKAGPGTYKLMLKSKDSVELGQLEIRADPINDSK